MKIEFTFPTHQNTIPVNTANILLFFNLIKNKIETAYHLKAKKLAARKSGEDFRHIDVGFQCQQLLQEANTMLDTFMYVLFPKNTEFDSVITALNNGIKKVEDMK